MTIYSTAITLFLVLDPIGNIPVFLSILSPVDAERRSRIVFRETLIALFILTAFLFFGKHILDSLSITAPALGISGGIILFLIALKMIFPPETDSQRDRTIGEPFIVPLAIPLVAGPSALTMVTLLGTQSAQDIWGCFIALLIAGTACMVILLFANNLRKMLGNKGIVAMERLMGMILTTVAIQMFLNGLGAYLAMPKVIPA